MHTETNPQKYCFLICACVRVCVLETIVSKILSPRSKQQKDNLAQLKMMFLSKHTHIHTYKYTQTHKHIHVENYSAETTFSNQGICENNTELLIFFFTSTQCVLCCVFSECNRSNHSPQTQAEIQKTKQREATT